MTASKQNRLAAIASVFLKLGTIGFGGPAAHIAMMEEETVARRKWLSREHFLDLMGATNLIPGPNSTEMAIHVGYSCGGVPGLALAGVCFIFPAVLLTVMLAWLYVSFGEIPQAEPLLKGIQAAVLAIIAAAVWRLGKKAVKSKELLAIAIFVAALLLVSPNNQVAALFLGGAIGMLWLRKEKQSSPKSSDSTPIDTPEESPENNSKDDSQNERLFLPPLLSLPLLATVSSEVPLWKLGLFFLKIGCVLFGSGYVLVAFLEGELVDKYQWLTQQQLLDAIAIGQFTPGPVLSASAFVGYVIAGLPGAIVATLGIFLPSFFFVLLLNPIIPRLRKSPLTATFLDAINVSAVGLMVVAALRLFVAIVFPDGSFSGLALAIALVAAIAAFRYRINAAWIVLGGAIVGGTTALL